MRARSFTRPVPRGGSESVAEHDHGLVSASDLLAGVPGREPHVLASVGSVDLGANGVPEIAQATRQAGSLQGRNAVPAVRVPANQDEAGAQREPGAGAVLRPEMVGRLRSRNVRERARVV